MKLEDFGIDPKTKVHDHRRLTTEESLFVGVLWVDHYGKENKISAEDLAVLYINALAGVEVDKEDLPEIIDRMKGDEIRRRVLEEWKRAVRYMQSHLLMRHDNLPIISKSGHNGGYWIAANEDEIEEFFNAFRKRGIHGIVKASRASKVRFGKIVEQLTFQFDDLVDKTGDTPVLTDDAREPAPFVVVDALLEKMMRNPEQFSEQLQKLGAKFGSVLLPKDQAEKIKEAAAETATRVAELTELMAGLAV